MFEGTTVRAYRPSRMTLEKVIDELDTPQARQRRLELYARRAEIEEDLFADEPGQQGPAH